MSPKTKSEIQWKYDRANTTRVSIKLNNKTDEDIIQYMASLENKQGYIKELIREDMKKQSH